MSVSLEDIDNSSTVPIKPTETLTARHWGVLLITMLLWLFDGYETYALLLTIGPSLHELLPPSELHHIPLYASYLISITLFGWAAGGVLGGFVGDRLGRRPTMILSVILYSIFTGTSTLSHSWQILALTRFLTGIGLGAEWGVGASLLQETWPEHLRTKGAGILQAAFSGGFLVASILWLVIGGWLGGSWRWMYIVGIIPALIVVAGGRLIPESERWQRVNHGWNAVASSLKEYRRSLIIACIVSISITLGFWAISSWIPTYVASLAHDPRKAVAYAGWAGALFAIGEMLGCTAFGWLAEAWGRRWTLAFYFVGSIIITPIVFLLVKNVTIIIALQLVNGILTGGLYGWYAIHPSEIFPTRIRSTAIGLIFNSARLVAMFGPIVASSLIGFFGGYGEAATIFSLSFVIGIIACFFLPETKGRSLPV